MKRKEAKKLYRIDISTPVICVKILINFIFDKFINVS